jgi:hypothetical protein
MTGSDTASHPPDGWAEWLAERLTGPACPACFRDDNTHSLGCPVPGYIEGWRRINKAHAEKGVDLFLPRTPT